MCNSRVDLWDLALKDKASLDEYSSRSKPGKFALRCFATVIFWQIHHAEPEPPYITPSYSKIASASFNDSMSFLLNPKSVSTSSVFPLGIGGGPCISGCVRENRGAGAG